MAPSTLLLNGKMSIQIDPDGPNPVPTVMVPSNLPSPRDRLHHPKSPLYPEPGEHNRDPFTCGG